jgi:hypothetical protein
MPIVLQAVPLKVINKGAFLRQHNKKLYETANTALGEKNLARKGLRITSQKVHGAVYIVFKCPGCATRNKKALKSAKYSSARMVAFVCHQCMNTVEVELHSLIQPESKIILP